MGIVLTERISGPEAWRGGDLLQHGQWEQHLSGNMLAALDRGLRSVRHKGLKAPDFVRSDFPLDDVKEEVAAYVDELQNGRGFLLLKGLSTEEYDEDDLAILYYGLGLYMGSPVTQNEAGQLLAEVTNVGDLNDPKTRVYQTNSYLPYHSDLSDVVGLLSVRKAKEGGLSSLISVAAIYNYILDHHPEYLGLLYRPLYFAHLGEELPSLSPIFSYYKGKLSCRYMRQYIELGQDLRGVPLSRVEESACDLFDSILNDPSLRLDMMLEPGDMQFANNYAVLHSRTGFEDYEDMEQRRKLLRLWLKMDVPRQLAPDFPGRNGIAARPAAGARAIENA